MQKKAIGPALHVRMRNENLPVKNGSSYSSAVNQARIGPALKHCNTNGRPSHVGDNKAYVLVFKRSRHICIAILEHHCCQLYIRSSAVMNKTILIVNH